MNLVTLDHPLTMRSGTAVLVRVCVLMVAAVCGWNTVSAAPFPTPQNMTVTTYRNGAWTERISIAKAENGWRGEAVKRDLWNLQQKAAPPLNLSLRADDNLQVAYADGSMLLWTSPTRLVRITPDGRRVTHTRESPIVQFTPEMLAANRLVLASYLATRLDQPFSALALRNGELVEYKFVKAERHAVAHGAVQKQVWRWAGSTASHPALYDKDERAMTAPFDLFMSDEGELVGWHLPMLDSVTVVDGYEELTPAAQWWQGSISRPQFTAAILDERQLIPMADRVPLAASVMVPGDVEGKALPGPFPTVLIRTPYGRKDSMAYALKFVSRGYAVVAQDVRGRGDSGGLFDALHDDISDGDVTLNWIAAQPWSDGKVGMIGPSYLAWVQWQAAASGNPHLKAMISIAASTSAFGDIPYVNGMFVTGFLTWSVYMGATAQQLAEAQKKDMNRLVRELPLIDADVRAAGHEIPFWRDWVRHSSLDEYWKKGNILDHQDKIDVPVLHVSGWFDGVLRGTMTAYDMMKANQRPNQHLILGPWPHSINSVRSLAELSFGADSTRSDLDYRYVRWFDHWLKGVDNGVRSEPPVNYFTVGENRWHTAQAWPPPKVTTRKWYLHSNGDAAHPGGGGRLITTIPAGKQRPDRYAHDPASPVPFLSDIRSNQGAGPEDYQEVERRSDTLVYTSEAFGEPYEITGSAVAELHAATDRPDTDWVVRLTDVFPDGRSVNIIDGYLRARFRNGMDKEALVPPGKVVRYRIPMAWTSYQFAAGHRMRVTIASAAAGAFAVNTNSGKPLATDTEVFIANQNIHRGSQYPSHIELSVLDR